MSTSRNVESSTAKSGVAAKLKKGAGGHVSSRSPSPKGAGPGSARWAHRWTNVLLDVKSGWLVTGIFFIVLVVLSGADPSSIPTMTEGLFLLTMCYGWNLVGGYLGELSFGHMIFWGVGGYGIVWAQGRSEPLMLWLIVLLLAAAAGGALMSGLIKWSGVEGSLTLAIFTLVLGEIVLSYVAGSDRFGGVEGLIALDVPLYSEQTLYLLLVGIAVIAAIANLVIGNSGTGRQWLAIRDDQVAAQVAGIHVERHRGLAYVVSASIFALGGAYQSYYSGYALPEVSLAIMPLILVVLAVFIGGPGTTLGPLVGWIIIYGLEAAAQSFSSSPDAALYARLVEFAAALVLLRFVLPRLGGRALSTVMLSAIKRFTPRRRESGPVEVLPVEELLLPVQAKEKVEGSPDSGLEVRDVHKSFGALQVLRGVSFVVRPGEVVGIVGPNGAGKSTLCNLISGIESVSAGAVLLDDEDVTAVPARKRSAVGVGRGFQAPRLFSSLSLAHNLTVSGGQLTETTASAVLAEMGVPQAGERYGDDSQFFARRLTEVAKATHQGHRVLLLDEPLAGLTSDEHVVVLRMAREAADAGACVAIVEHLIPVLAPAVDRIVALADGRVIADGPPSEVLHHPDLIEAYLGAPPKEHDQ